MIPSPYTPGEAPQVLVGRDDQLENARADLALMSTYGRFHGRVRVDLGSRGVGKTSLLKAVQDAALEAGAVTAWVTARADESLVGSLVQALAEALDRIGVDVGPRGEWLKRLRGFSVELGALGVKGGVEVDLAGSSDGPAAASSAALASLVADAALAVQERGSAGLALLVDEIQAAPREDLRTLAYAWQELQGRRPESPAVVFTVGLPNAPDVLTAAVTFSERFWFRTLERLSPADAAEVLEGPAREQGVRWDPALVDQVVAIADGYPYFLQLYGDAVWRVARPDDGVTLGADLLDPARDRVEQELATMFRARWAKVTAAERRLVAAMAGLTDDAETPVRRAAIADAMGVSSNDLSVARRSLLDKGLLETVDRGTLRFTLPGFAAFVRGETGGR
jgi:hypothetical protein